MQPAECARVRLFQSSSGWDWTNSQQRSSRVAMLCITVHTHVPTYVLCVAGAQASLWASVAPYLPQLHSLTIDEQPPAYADTDLDHDLHLSAALCFTPQYTTHTLTHLSLAGRLEPWLAQVLAKHAPALTTLDIPYVMSMQMRPSYRPGHWSVRTLRLGEGAFHTSALTWLPLPAEGKMVVQLSERGTVELPVTTDSKVKYPERKTNH